MTERVNCCVPGCKRTIGRARLIKSPADEYVWFEWTCPAHWALVPARMKRAYARIKRRERKFDVHLPAGGRIWRRIKIELGALPPLA